MSAIAIRQLDAESWREWRELRQAALAEAPQAFSSTLEEWSGEGDTEARWRKRLDGVPLNLLAAVDGRTVGMVSATAPMKGGTAGEVELMSMWVSPQGRGTGVGDALIEAVFGWARDQGAGQVGLCVREGNQQAIALYSRHGFSDVGRSSEPGDPLPERHMVADLTASTERELA